MFEAQPKSDSFTVFYVVLTLGFYLLLAFSWELDRAFNLFILLVPILLIPGLLLAVTLLVGLTLNLFRRRWRRVLSVLMAPFAAAVPLFLCQHLGLTPTWLRFTLNRSHYDAEIARMVRQADAPRLKAFDWGETGGAGSTNQFLTLVFDEAGEIILSADQRSKRWLEQARQDWRLQGIHRDGAKVNIQHLGGHFYAVTQTD
ncbi:hypothetical protein [Methylobacterium marchantiae]|uniref:Uncharacterized protein n=1 Tax=Methylobacterium marchantiae TaxID=600331 RepID=A0ABW3X0F8_9HYPH